MDVGWIRTEAGNDLICGVDEAGRGPLAGPVTAAAVILPPQWAEPLHFNESKAMPPGRRLAMADTVRARAVSSALGWASSREVDAVGVLEATMRAMARAVHRLERQPHTVLVDGRQVPSLPVPAFPVIKGDTRYACIAAASILAKTARDGHMQALAARHPSYGWASNAGYGVPAHMTALMTHGLTRHHRRRFKPVAAHIAQA
jgi:ribonuclease HII